MKGNGDEKTTRHWRESAHEEACNKVLQLIIVSSLLLDCFVVFPLCFEIYFDFAVIEFCRRWNITETSNKFPFISAALVVKRISLVPYGILMARLRESCQNYKAPARISPLSNPLWFDVVFVGEETNASEKRKKDARVEQWVTKRGGKHKFGEIQTGALSCL